MYNGVYNSCLGYWFCYQYKAQMQLLTTSDQKPGFCLTPFPRPHELMAKSRHFFPPLSFNAFSLGEPCWISRPIFLAKTRLMALSVNENFEILSWAILTQCQCVSDGQTDSILTIDATALAEALLIINDADKKPEQWKYKFLPKIPVKDRQK